MKKIKASKGSNVKVTEYIREAKKEIEQKEEELNIEIPQQPEFFKTPIRFGSIPVDKLPLGCDEKEQYRKIYPKISLPFQVVEKISFGHKELESNRLIFGDNLHIMRALPSNFIDLIYIDPPFFSGRNYNIVFGDQNELRSFTDIWEGGMPGYLTWLNARLLEMKRLLKSTGSIYIHCDWHASHYIKQEMDKIFGYENFRNEIVWLRKTSSASKTSMANSHDIILYYTKSDNFTFNQQYLEYSEEYVKSQYTHKDDKGIYRIHDVVANPALGGNSPRYPYKGYMPKTRWLMSKDKLEDLDRAGKILWSKSGKPYRKLYLHEMQGQPLNDIWNDIPISLGKEKIGYPTQKPEELLTRIIKVASDKGDIVADFFCGGGTTPFIAQTLGRRWIVCDISKIAISVTRDRILREISNAENKKEIQQTFGKVPDISIEHWGIYEVPQLVKMNEETFRNFIIAAYNGRLTTSEGLIHGYKNQIPIFVGSSSQDKPITEIDVINFAKDIVKKKGHHQGIMIAWAFTPGAQISAQQLEVQHALAIDFVKIQLIPIESKDFREHVTSKHPEYRNLLKFILPPQVRISTKKIKDLEYMFDVSESVSLNPGGKIINVQWDFTYNGERFVSTPEYSFLGMKDNKPILKVIYKFNSFGKKKIACKVQDDEGGEKIEIFECDVK